MQSLSGNLLSVAEVLVIVMVGVPDFRKLELGTSQQTRGKEDAIFRFGD